MTAPDQHIYPKRARNTPISIILNIIRGGLIGMAELVPGISGGTVALVVGIYERALAAGNSLLDVVTAAVKDRARLNAAVAKVDWLFLLAVGVGMVVMVFSVSTVLSNFVENHPEISRGLFMGMVAVSIIVPVGMMEPKDLKKKLPVAAPLFVVAAIVSFIGTGYTSSPQENPSLIIIFLAAAVAVCALVMPGVSGSFFLLALGLYAPVMNSLSNREWDVIGVFALGALLGIILFIRALSWVLENHRTITLTLMAGLMLGSLRALWPWQNDDAALLAPYGSSGQIWAVIGMIALGAAIVAGFIIAEKLSPKQSVVRTEADPV